MAAQRSPVVRGTLAGVVAVLLALVLLPHAGGRSLVGDGTDSAVLVPHDASGSCSLPASQTGLCGTVAGFSGWYGSWATAGGLGAFCLEHAKSEPRPALDYTRKGTARGNVSAPVETQQRLGYLLGRYGGTTDATRAAALAILVHAGEGDTLTTGDLGSYSTSLPAAVRTSVLSLWQESGDLHGPYVASLAVAGSGLTATGVLTLRSASGHPVPGMSVVWDGSPAGTSTTVTDASGTARLTVTGVGGAGGTVTMHARVDGLAQDDFAVWIPTDSSVQRVAVPLPTISVSATGSWTAAPSAGSLQILKHTDDPAFVSPAGAVFAVVNSAGATISVVTAAGDGTTPVIGSLVPGNYQVVEQTPCGGCTLAAPVAVSVAPAAVAGVVVTDHVLPHQLTLRKVTPDGQPLAGAVLHARGQSTTGAVYDLDLGTCTTGADGSCALSGGNALAPETVQVTEESPAPGTVLATPAVQVADLTAGDATVTFVDPRLVSVGFHKTDDAPGSVVDHAHESLAGAVFVVSGGVDAGGGAAGGEVGRCTTGDDGTCVLPGAALVEGAAYAWTETVAPPGFAVDPVTHAFTASCEASCAPAVQSAADVGRYAAVSLVKHAAGAAGTPVPGAVVDLCAGADLPASLAATYAAPSESACGTGTTWVAAATTGTDGHADFGLVPPGVHYCAVERTAPTGWELATTPVCGDLGPAGSIGDSPPAQLVLDLAEQRTPIVPQTVTPVVSPSVHPTSPVPSRQTHVAAVATTRPAATRPATTTPSASPPARSPAVKAPVATPAGPTGPTGPTGPAGPTGPTGSVRPPELAYTGTQDVAPLLAGGLGLVAVGALALLAAAALARRGTGCRQPVWGGWIPGEFGTGRTCGRR